MAYVPEERTPLEQAFINIIYDRTQAYGSLNTIDWLIENGLSMEEIINLNLFEDIELSAHDIMTDVEKMRKAVKYMDEIVRNFNDEEIHMYWLAYGLADGSTDEDIETDIESEEDFEGFAAAYLECISMAKTMDENITQSIAYFTNTIETALYS